MSKLQTTKERREKRIKQLEARLQKERALQTAAKRKERNGQLICWGVLVETIYKQANQGDREKMIQQANRYLTGRNLDRALAGFKRLDQS